MSPLSETMSVFEDNQLIIVPGILKPVSVNYQLPHFVCVT